MPEILTRVCSKCGLEKTLDTINYRIGNKIKNQWRGECRKCESKRESDRVTYRTNTDPGFKLKKLNASRLRIALKSTGGKNGEKTMDWVGCSRDFLREHIKAQWKPGMTWDNHNVHGWHIDHIIPIASAKGDREKIKELSHYKNLQPMWADENIRKSDKMPHELEQPNFI